MEPDCFAVRLPDRRCDSGAVSGIDGVQPVSGTDRYAQSDMEQLDFILYRMDSKTMKLTQVLLAAAGKLCGISRPRRRNRLSAGVRPENGNVFAVLSARRYGQTELPLTEAQQQAAHTVYQSARGCIICTDETTGYKLAETGVEPLGVAVAGICQKSTEDGGDYYAEMYGGRNRADGV